MHQENRSASCYPTRWAWNKSQKQQRRKFCVSCRHPTQWAQNEVYYLLWHYTFWGSLSHPVGSEPVVFPEDFFKLEDLSPSHTVGSELMDECQLFFYHYSHHPTRWAYNLQKEEKILLAQTLYKLSPSHTVGSKQSTNGSMLQRYRKRIAIPRGGLRTRRLRSFSEHVAGGCHHPTQWA